MNAEQTQAIAQDLLGQLAKKHPDSGVYIKTHTANGETVYIENITISSDETGNLIIDCYEC